MLLTYHIIPQDGIRWRIYRCGSLEIRTMQVADHGDHVILCYITSYALSILSYTLFYSTQLYS